ncbi:unnamed protein product [Moneuplotes crassus]|uniref:Uncharacterized protein n=1 Tax=Euplotes crassus TaxID=5936 RepID=A0AAD1YA75_EUPCR|nr:unnamed protein product [Moneuplotes crassus]
MKDLFITETDRFIGTASHQRRVPLGQRSKDRNFALFSLNQISCSLLATVNSNLTGRRTPSVTLHNRTGRLFQDNNHRDSTPGPCGYLIPSDLISGKAQRFGKPENYDVFQTKHKEFVPGPDSYFAGVNEKFSTTFHSEGFTFPRSERKMFNDTTTQSQGLSSLRDPTRDEVRSSSFSKAHDDFITFKDKKFDPVGPGYYKPNDRCTTKNRCSSSFRFGRKNIEIRSIDQRRKPKKTPNLFEKLSSKETKREKLNRLFKEINEKSKIKVESKEKSHKGFQKFSHLHLKHYDKEHYVRIFLGKKSMFDSEIIMKNIDACDFSQEISTDPSRRSPKYKIEPGVGVEYKKQRILAKAKTQSKRRQEVLERYTNIISDYHDKSLEASKMRKTIFDIRMSAHFNWHKSSYCKINDSYLINSMKRAICEDISAKFEAKYKIRHSSNKLCRWFCVAMKATGKFLVFLREIRKKKAIQALGPLLLPMIKRRRVRKILEGIKNDKELAFIHSYNSQCKDISKMILMTSPELRRIKAVFKKLLFRRKLVKIITHFHWFLIENVVFNQDSRKTKKASLEIIKIRKEWKGEIRFIVPYKVRNMYIKHTKFYIKLKHLRDYRLARKQILDDMKREEIRRTSTNFFLEEDEKEEAKPDDRLQKLADRPKMFLSHEKMIELVLDARLNRKLWNPFLKKRRNPHDFKYIRQLQKEVEEIRKLNKQEKL